MKTKVFLCCVALTGHAACTPNPEAFFYEVTQRTAGGVSIQVNKGNTDLQSTAVEQMLTHMDGMAIKECEGLGKSGATVTAERNYTTGPYYSWIERTYQCR